MNRMLLAGTALVAAMGLASAANAQTWLGGAYVAADLGYAWPEGIDGTSDVNASDGRPYEWTFSAENTPSAYLRMGTRISPMWRVELEGGYHKSDMERVMGDGSRAQPVGLCTAGVLRTAAAPTCGPPAGELRVGTLMLNALWDFMPGSRWHPFIGGGIGWAEVHNKVYGQLSGVPAGAARFQNTSFDDVDGAFAAQAILGISYDLTDRLTLDLTGRYMGTGDLSFGSNTQNAGAGGLPGGTITHVGIFEGNYRETNASIGLRYTFASPPPPPPPPVVAPPPPPPPPPPPATQTCPDGSVILATDTCPVAPPPPPPPPAAPVRG